MFLRLFSVQTVKLSFGVASGLCGANGSNREGRGGGFTRSGIRSGKQHNQIRESMKADRKNMRIRSRRPYNQIRDRSETDPG